MIKVVCKVKLRPDIDREKYFSLSRKMVEETRKEPGCCFYAVHEDIHDPSILAVIEEWADEEALEQHSKSEHVQKIGPELKKMRVSTELNVYREILNN